MTNRQAPQYLLLSESKSTAMPGQAESGLWRFQLESIDGSAIFSASDEERGISGERLELLAVVRGLEALDQPSAVTLVTNSRYVSHGIRFGLTGWREAGWRWEYFGRMSTIANADLWQRIGRALEIHEVRCRHLSPSRPELALAKALDQPGRRWSPTWWSHLWRTVAVISATLRIARSGIGRQEPVLCAH